MHVVFVDPPDGPIARKAYGHPQQHPWASIAEQLRDNPGRWGLCLRDVAVSPSSITAGKITAFQPAGAFQARTVQTHKVDERGRKLVDLYIKYEPAEEGQ